MNRENFKVLEGYNQGDPESRYSSLRQEHACGLDQKPQWCVYGHDRDGVGFGVLHWIKPSPKGEWVARELAKLITNFGGNARAEMTEFNEDLKGEPVYDSAEHTDRIIGDTPLDDAS